MKCPLQQNSSTSKSGLTITDVLPISKIGQIHSLRLYDYHTTTTTTTTTHLDYIMTTKLYIVEIRNIDRIPILFVQIILVNLGFIPDLLIRSILT